MICVFFHNSHYYLGDLNCGCGLFGDEAEGRDWKFCWVNFPDPNFSKKWSKLSNCGDPFIVHAAQTQTNKHKRLFIVSALRYLLLVTLG